MVNPDDYEVVADFRVFRLLKNKHVDVYAIFYKNKYYDTEKMPEHFISDGNNINMNSINVDNTCYFGIVTNKIFYRFELIDVAFVGNNKVIVRIGKQFSIHRDIYKIKFEDEKLYDDYLNEITNFKKILQYIYCRKYNHYNPKILI